MKKEKKVKGVSYTNSRVSSQGASGRPANGRKQCETKQYATGQCRDTIYKDNKEGRTLELGR
jgi:hypothetical protein